MSTSQGRSPAEPSWPEHRDDAPPSDDPRSLRRGILGGAAVLMMTVALLAAGPWSTQIGGTVLMLGWIAAVGFGALAYRGRPPVVLTLTRLGLVLGLLSLTLALLLYLVGLQVREILVGTITFGTAGSGCTVESDAASFADGVPVYQAAHLARTVEPGEVVTLTTELDGEVFSTKTSMSSTQRFDCMGGAVDVARPGAYAVTVSTGSEVLAEGSFEVTLSLE